MFTLENILNISIFLFLLLILIYLYIKVKKEKLLLNKLLSEHNESLKLAKSALLDSNSEIENSNELYANLLKEQQKLVATKFSETALDSSFYNFAELIGKAIKAEILIMGRIDKDTMIDKGFYTSFTKSEKCIKAIDLVKSINVKESIIFKTINSKQIYHELTDYPKYRQRISSTNLIGQNKISIFEQEILNSGKIREILAIGLETKDKLYGYLIAINRIDNFKNFSSNNIRSSVI